MRGYLDWSKLSAATLQHVESGFPFNRVYQWDSFIASSSQLPTSYAAAPLAGGVDLRCAAQLCGCACITTRGTDSAPAATAVHWLHQTVPSSARYIPVPTAAPAAEHTSFPGVPRTLGGGVGESDVEGGQAK